MRLSLIQVVERAKIIICSRCGSDCRKCPWPIDRAIKTVQSQEDRREGQTNA